MKEGFKDPPHLIFLSPKGRGQGEGEIPLYVPRNVGIKGGFIVAAPA
jgi:hypothetical protein